MKGTYSKTFALCLSAAAAGLALASDGAYAQQTEQIIIVAPRQHPEQNPNRLYLTQPVGFADLDLRTDWGAQTLGARIGYAAEESCKLLDRYYPDSVTIAAKATRKDDCVAGAVYDAQPQFQAVVFAARQ